MRKKIHQSKLAIKPGRPPGSITRYPGLNDAAAKLGVSPSHLSRVLAGARTSQRLASALRALKGHPLLFALQTSKHPIAHV